MEVVQDAFDTSGKKLFVGIEYEGPNAGLQTLFVQGDVDVQLILKTLREAQGVQMVYFGAGRLSQYDPGTIGDVSRYLMFTDRTANVKITLESQHEQVALLKECPQLYHMLTVTMPGRNIPDEDLRSVLTRYQTQLEVDEKHRVIVKIDTGSYVLCSGLDNFAVNDYSGYKNDVLLWEE